MPNFDSRTENLIDKVKVTEKQMSQALKNLNGTKSPGPDEIHPRILKELHVELAKPLTVLFNNSILESKIPVEWKIAEVRPIFKKGDKSQAGNYRPVSLTSIVCKLFEGFIRDALYDHLVENELLSRDQYGFCSGRSCVTQLLTTVTDWMEYLDQGIPVDSIYLDLRKAFDTVPHQRLIHKLKGYGIRDNLLHWIADFLNDRSQYVSIKSVSSSRVPVTSGVPQGSVLGPILFIYYINDMPDEIKNKLKIFADDTKAYSKILSEFDRELLQSDIDRLIEWTDDWLLRFNKGKCKVLHLGKNNPKYDYYMTCSDDTTVIESTSGEKDLGVTVDPLLEFDVHINEVVKRANRLAGLIQRTLTYKNDEILLPLFKGLVRPILEYANPVWNPSLRKFVNLVENVQRRYTKKIVGYKELSYEERLAKLRLPSLEYRRLRGDLIEMYKMTHNIYDPCSVETLFKFSDSEKSTRGHNYKLEKVHTNTSLFRNFFTNRIINTWNNLPVSAVNASSLNAFKNELDRHFKEIKYQTDLRVHLNP